MYPRLSTEFGMVVFFINFSLMEFQVIYLALFLFLAIDSFGWFWMGSLHKNMQIDWASDLWQQLELASELESDMWDTVDWGKKWLFDFNAGKTQLVSFDWSNNTGPTDVKSDGSVLEEKSYLKILGLTFSSTLDWGSCWNCLQQNWSFDSFYEISFWWGCLVSLQWCNLTFWALA